MVEDRPLGEVPSEFGILRSNVSEDVGAALLLAIDRGEIMGMITKIQIVFSETDDRDHAKALFEIRKLLEGNIVSMSWQSGDDMKRLKYRYIAAHDE